MALQSPLVVSSLKVPQLDGGVLGGRDHAGEYRVEDDPVREPLTPDELY